MVTRAKDSSRTASLPSATTLESRRRADALARIPKNRSKLLDNSAGLEHPLGNLLSHSEGVAFADRTLSFILKHRGPAFRALNLDRNLRDPGKIADQLTNREECVALGRERARLAQLIVGCRHLPGGGLGDPDQDRPLYRLASRPSRAAFDSV